MEVQGNFGPILTQNPRMKEVIKSVSRVAASDVNVLVTGESGTGKNLLSRAIHNASKRRKAPYVAVNCIAIPDALFESELFGHERGAFTDAHQTKRGCFETGNGGTVFFDEIGDMTQSAQGKILQLVEEKYFRRVGSENQIHSDVRIICATNKDLARRVDEGAFREDLFFRLNEVSILLPPLRERPEDIPLLIRHFVECYGQMYGKGNLKISDAAVNYLTHYRWPGNFREMKNVIKSAVLLCPKDTVWLEHFPFEICLRNDMKQLLQNGSAPEECDFSLENVLKSHIVQALRFFNWNKMKSARALNISRPRLDRYILKFNLEADS